MDVVYEAQKPTLCPQKPTLWAIGRQFLENKEE